MSSPRPTRRMRTSTPNKLESAEALTLSKPKSPVKNTTKLRAKTPAKTSTADEPEAASDSRV